MRSVFAQSLELLNRQAGASENAFERLAFEDEIAVDWNDRLAAVRFTAKDVVTAGRAVNDKAKPQENLENFFGSDGRKMWAHAVRLTGNSTL